MSSRSRSPSVAGRHSSVAVLTALASALAATSALAASSPVSSEPDTSYLAGAVEPERVGLTLEQAQKLAAAHSPTTRAALAALRVARGARMREAGAFDPVLFGADERVSTDTPVSSPFEASKTRVRSLSGGASWVSPIGTSVNVSLARVRAETDAQFSTLPVERRARARLDVVQPLLRGFGLGATRGELRAADRELEAAQRNAEAASLDLGAAVENAYWELYAAERDQAAERLQRQRAAVFLRDQLIRARAGVVGPGAVATARTFMAAQEAQLLDARVRVGTASEALALVVGTQAGEADQRYHCLDDPPEAQAVEPLSALVKRALEANPSLRAAELDVAAARARARGATLRAWPTVEAFGGYGGSGLAGVGRQITFSGQTVGSDFDTGFGHAWDQVWGDDFPDWNLGLRVNMPLGWRADRGERQRQLGILEGALATRDARRLALLSAVRQAHLEAELAERQLQAMRDLVEAAREQARIANLEYRAGRSTAYDVVVVEAELREAQFRESQALVRAAHAATELRRLTTPVFRRTP